MMTIIGEDGTGRVAKYGLGQQVAVTGFRHYLKGKVVKVSAVLDDNGYDFVYNVELSSGSRRYRTTVRRYREAYVFGTVDEALAALSVQERECGKEGHDGDL